MVLLWADPHSTARGLALGFKRSTDSVSVDRNCDHADWPGIGNLEPPSLRRAADLRISGYCFAVHAALAIVALALTIWGSFVIQM